MRHFGYVGCGYEHRLQGEYAHCASSTSAAPEMVPPIAPKHPMITRDKIKTPRDFAVHCTMAPMMIPPAHSTRGRPRPNLSASWQHLSFDVSCVKLLTAAATKGKMNDGRNCTAPVRPSRLLSVANRGKVSKNWGRAFVCQQRSTTVSHTCRPFRSEPSYPP